MEIIEGIKKDLISMSYREMKPNVWGKPFGYHLITFELDKNLWTNWFMNSFKEPLIWNSIVYIPNPKVENHFLNFIQYCEACTNVNGHKGGTFEFFTTAELINLGL